MHTIYKYPLTPKLEQVIQIHSDHDILTLQTQSDPVTETDVPTIWAEVETDSPLIDVTIHIVGTGWAIPSDATRYIGTFQQQGGALIWHVYKGELNGV